MTRIEKILNQHVFPPETMTLIHRKKTESGMIKALSSFQAARAALFPDDETVYQRIYNARRLNSNDTCARCGNPIGKNYKQKNDRKYKCGICSEIVSPLLGTPLSGVKSPLNRIIHLIYQTYISRKGCSTAKTSREIAVKYDTLLSLRHRANSWMGLTLKNMNFAENVPIEIDEVYMPIPDGLPKYVKRTPGLGSEGIKPVVVMAQRGGLVKAFVMDEVIKETIQPLFSNVSTTNPIYSDGNNVYNFLTSDGFQHAACNHSKKQFAIGEVHVNTDEAYNGISKGQVKHVHHGVSEQHLQGYMDDAAFAFSHRFSDVYEAMDNLFKNLPPLHYQPHVSRR